MLVYSTMLYNTYNHILMYDDVSVHPVQCFITHIIAFYCTTTLVSSTMLYNTYTHILLYDDVSVQYNAL